MCACTCVHACKDAHCLSFHRTVFSRMWRKKEPKQVSSQTHGNKHTYLFLNLSPALISLSLRYLYGDAERRRLMGRLLYYLPSGHRTESHIPHLSLFLFPFCGVSFSPTNRSSSPLFLHVSSAHSSIPLAFMFCSYSHLSCHCRSVSFTPFPLQSICSSLVFPPPFFPFFSSSFHLFSSPGCVFFFYLTLLFSCGCMPFTWEPFYPSLKSSELRCAYLAV